MSRRRNGTNRAAATLGLSIYGPMNTGKRKRPKEEGISVDALTKSINNMITRNGGNCK